ncbi:MAG: hypothetical protein ACE5ED_06400 [Rhodothalassiaceae bacterium]
MARLVLVFLSLFLAIARADGGEARFPVVATIATGAAPHGMRIVGDRLYIAAAGADAIEVADLASGRIVERWPVAHTPLGLVRSPHGWYVTQFRGEALVALDDRGRPTGDSIPVGKSPSLFAPHKVGDLAYVVSEFADRLSVLDTASGAIVARYETGKRPYPADVTHDGVLAFVPNREEGTVSVIDLLNRRERARVPVCKEPEGGALTADEVSYLVACAGGDRIVAINTASFGVTGTLGKGVGPRPFSVAVSPDGRFAFTNNAGGETVTVFDPKRLTVLDAVTVGAKPIVLRVAGDRLYVASEDANTVSVIAIPPPPPPVGTAKNEVLVLGMIHGNFRTSERYSLAVLERLIRAYDPDYVVAEIPPNRLDAAMAGFKATGRVSEPRLSVFPEYTDLLFPLSRSLDFTIIPAAAWNEPMNDYRNAMLARIRADPRRKADWAAYRAGMAHLAAAVRGRADDPCFIHSTAYDQATREAFEPYDRLFNEELGPGGWSHINAAHYALIERALEAHRGEGKRFLITFGASHKYWFLEHLRQRDDITLLDARPFLDAVLKEPCPAP